MTEQDIDKEEIIDKRKMALDNYVFYGSMKYFFITLIASVIALYLFYRQIWPHLDVTQKSNTVPVYIYIAAILLLISISAIRLCIWSVKRKDVAFINDFATCSEMNRHIFQGKLRPTIYAVLCIYGANIMIHYNYIVNGSVGRGGGFIPIVDVFVFFLIVYQSFRVVAWYLLRDRVKK